MKDGQARVIYLKDYQPPNYTATEVSLDIDLADDETIVRSVVSYQRHEAFPQADVLRLHGEAQELLSVSLNGELLGEDRYVVDDESLTLRDLPPSFELTLSSRIHPQNNTSLEGLYQSGGKFCTQCEAEGFRKITYFLDRPDVLAEYTTRVSADKSKYPVLLSNGNRIDSGDLDGGRHFAVWHDPHKKPSYLFALVAGDLACVRDTHTTPSGREVSLEIHTEPHNVPRCDHALQSLKRAMIWDEERFGLEYDLDVYMIVAVDDFNMGAMENKGLNVFNSKLVFASPDTATDMDYINIEAVVGHEYFHNWTGNRVTCRDWFQLSLKEGLTVFRDQEFTADLHSRAVKRIEDVRLLRSHQFAEDASPMAHPVRPDSFMEINNFYTVTIYEKGAEVVRLYHTLLGTDGFRKGMDLYFERHDGQAVTTEEFLAAMADANGADLSQMQIWYEQAGTPDVKVTLTHDAAKQECTLHFAQSCRDTPESDSKQPFLIPMTLSLLGADGKALPLLLSNDAGADKAGADSDNKAAGNTSGATARTLQLTKATQSFTFTGIAEKPVPSLLAGFSAPVNCHYDYSTADTLFLMQHDPDSFNRWEASQRLAKSLILDMLEDRKHGRALGVDPEVIDAWQRVLENDALDHALRAEALSLPGESDIAEAVDEADPQAIHEVREFLLTTLATAMRIPLEQTHSQLHQPGDYIVDAASIGQRRLRNICLSLLARINDESIHALCFEQFEQASNMTDRLAALAALSHIDCPQRQQAFDAFEARFGDNSLVMDKWLMLQAGSTLPDTLDTVKALQQHPAFDAGNPNRIRSLIGRFANANPVNFHNDDGSGYAFLRDFVIDLDARNPQVAARLVRALSNWRGYEPKRSAAMKEALKTIHAHAGLSGDVFEIVEKSLA